MWFVDKLGPAPSAARTQAPPAQQTAGVRMQPAPSGAKPSSAKAAPAPEPEKKKKKGWF